MSIYSISASLACQGIKHTVVAADPEANYQHAWLQLLATVEEAQIHAQNAHWNVRGNNFMEIHKYFEDVIGFFQSSQDAVAEMLKSIDIDYLIPNGAKKLLSHSLIAELSDKEVTSPRGNLKMLLKIINVLRKHVHEMNALAEENKHVGGLNYLGELAQELDKRRWFTKAFLKA